MKKSTTLSALLGLLLFTASCENPVLNGGGDDPTETRIVRMSLSEEQAPVTEEPLRHLPAKAKESGRVYAINIYQKSTDASKYSKYAYGLFDDPSQMSIALQTGSVYRFECTESRDDQESVFHNENGYASPYRHGGVPTQLENQFVLSSTENFDYVVDGSGKGWVNVTADDSIRCPRMYRYYALVDGFDPSLSETISVELKRAVFGLHLIITPPADGTVSLSYLFREATVAAGAEAYDHEAVYSFNQISRACADGYSGEFPFVLTWTRADGTKVTKQSSITLKRNVMTTLNVNVEGRNPSGFRITEENTEMGKETLDWVVKSE